VLECVLDGNNRIGLILKENPRASINTLPDKKTTTFKWRTACGYPNILNKKYFPEKGFQE